MANYKIKRSDKVIVISGAHSGRTGRVLKVMPERDAVLIEKVNIVKRQVKPRGDTPGGTIEKEAPIHISNVAYYNEAEDRLVKIGWKVLDDGRKVRFDKKTGAVID